VLDSTQQRFAFAALNDGLEGRIGVGVLDSGFWILVSGFWFLDSGFWIPVSGFWILVSALP